ncbi:MAG: hypothetical protein FJX75_00185 [Armatimonadetes bacterium]|nr:hypothetical protein [Armatimonadota bacterium]
MEAVSVFNEVIGPVMRGPSSSHNAGAHRIATLARSLLGDAPRSVTFTFDPEGSYAPTYRVCGADLAFAAGLLGIPMTAGEYHEALHLAEQAGVTVRFEVRPLPDADHPNHVEIDMATASGERLQCAAASVGGGAIVVSRLDEWPVRITGKWHEVLVECRREAEGEVSRLLAADGRSAEGVHFETRGDLRLACAHRTAPLASSAREALVSIPGVERVWSVPPVFFVPHGSALFVSAIEAVALAEERGVSLGQVTLDYECRLLGLTEEEALAEIEARWGVMRGSVEEGLAGSELRLNLLNPSAAGIMQAEGEGRLLLGGPHTRAAARAMAVMHVSNSRGVVCAAPTGGSAGTIPGALMTVAEELGLADERIALALFAASAVGLVVARRATFAAETAGCQVEIGAAGAMAAAALVEAAGGAPQQAIDAAAIAFHNCMGLVCDPVQGGCEIPCHTRNAVAASSAFVCADLILGGYENPIPLDETIDAVLAVGQMMPRELRCTALGGIAAVPSAQHLGKRT